MSTIAVSGASCPPGQVLSSRLLRAGTPSLSDCFFLSMLVWLFLAGTDGWSRLLLDGDAGWHIRTGEYILDHARVPRQDLFSFSKPAAEWFAWEWGADVIFAGLHRAAGLKGMTLACGVLIALYATVLIRFMIWRGANALFALAVALLAVGASSVHFLARPHLFTLVLVPVSLWILEHDRRSPGRLVWTLVPLAALWTNLHGGFMALLAFLGLLAIGTSLEILREPAGRRNWRPLARYSLLTASCSLATLVNPYGWHLHRHIVGYLQSDWIRQVVQEFQSPSFRTENLLQFEVLLFAGLFTSWRMLGRGKWTEVLWILFWAHQALASVRHLTVYVSVAAPLLVAEWSELWRRWVEPAAPTSFRRILDGLSTDLAHGFRRTSLWPAICLILLSTPLPLTEWPSDFPELKFPVGIAARHASQIRQARVLTTDQWADYLIYRNFPQQRVFFDGRSDFYGPALGREYIRLSNGQHDWRNILLHHEMDVALIPVEWPLSSLLKEDPTWRILEDDGKAILFVRVRPKAEYGAPTTTAGTGKKPLSD